MINNILPKIQANLAGAADALMLDGEGFVSETNATNVFMVKGGVVYTPLPDYCLPGITRRTVIAIVRGRTDIPDVVERRISLAEFHAADEVFTTGSMGELTPVVEIDGRKIGLSKSRKHGETGWPMTNRIQAAYRALTETEGVRIPA
jgi:branched-subunit amino acid aminotransferase/4-amino-4-deoxychorismate lyase